ncbi:LAFE_0D01574g1_1 [Lachancea fermentati]|uniref:LAFE_0D01574g1_1 n=1 Tax=Lachancea fermentati TaxID=4955 RepID=A0A1G4MB53_LACFM|nr:LAFE_0D01574g1_1 [Lachancea fermentati]
MTTDEVGPVIVERIFNSEPLLYKEDPEKYSKEFIPKINKYREEIKCNIPPEAVLSPGKVDSDLIIPEDFEEIAFKDGMKVAAKTKILTEKELEIVNLTAVEIVDAIAKGDLSAVETITAFIKQAAIALQITNCAMQFFPEEALARARELDEYYKKTGKTVGPMHGLPMSLKEHYGFKGKTTNAGFASMIDHFTADDALTTAIFRKAGAVFYIRTTQPQSLMHLDSSNNITGRCRNPHNTALSPGGSTSGEGALIALNGSPLGTGSDIGGSIRAPAAFCHIWGFKPTNKRVSLMGAFASYRDMSNDTVLCSVGPLANSADDLALYMKTFLDAEPWLKDNYITRAPWRSDIDLPLSSLKIGIVFDDGIVKPSPPVLRALKLAKESLEKAGVGKCIEWVPYQTAKGLEICNVAYNVDGNFNHRSRYEESGEPLRPLSEHHMRFGCGDKGVSTQELLQLIHDRDEYRQQFADVMNETDIDFVLTPAYFAPAAIPDKIKYWGYTALYNILDLPGVSFPTGLVTDPSLDAKDTQYVPRNPLEEYEYPMYDETVFAGSPVGLTLHGRRHYDEETLAATKLIQEIIFKAAQDA